jgi:type I restriction enzyme S subunit
MKGPVIKLGDVVTLQPGFAFNAAGFGDRGDLPLVRIRDVSRGFSSTYYSGEYEPEFLVKDGDLLISMDGEFRVGRWKGGRALLNQRVCRIVPHPRTVDSSYLFHLLPKELKRIEDATPYATVKHLSGGKIAGIRTVLPPISEQCRIAAILDKAEDIRWKHEESLQQARRLIESTFLDMFGDPITNPKHWKVVPMLDIAEGGRRGVTTGPFGTQLGSSDFVPKGLEVYGIYSVGFNGEFITGGKKFVTPEKYKSLERFRVLPGDILFSRMGTIGRICIVPDGAPPGIVSYHLIRIRPQRSVCRPGFLAALLGIRMSSAGVVSRLSRGAIMNGVNAGIVSSVPIYLPPIERQDTFIRRVRLQQCVAQRLEISMEESERLAQGLLQSVLK